MTPSQMLGYALNSVTTVTAITSTRIYNGTRPVGSTLPCINYFEMPGGLRSYGIERLTFSINCRASTAEVASNLARKVADLFHGTSSTGVYGEQNGFGIIRGSVRQMNGVIFETGEDVYNSPVDVLVVFPSGAVT